jgi:hypothetical protein
MARLRNRKNQAVRFFTNGKLAQNAYGLFDHVGQVVKRTDKVAKLARAGTARKATPIARDEVLKTFNVKSRQLSGKFSTRTTGDTVRLFASDRQLPLIAFGGKWSGRESAGATAEVVRGDRKTYENSWIGAVKGLTSIRVRKRVGGGRRAPRGPLKILRGPSPREMILGLQTDPETRRPRGTYPNPPVQRIVARLAAFHVAEIRRLFDVEAKRG